MKNIKHGPCGDAWLMINVRNIFREIYRRRDNGVSYEQPNSRTVDNRWVVPCSTLLEMFNCHINVEALSSIQAVKYMYKYIYKEHDAANIILNEQNEERLLIMMKLRIS